MPEKDPGWITAALTAVLTFYYNNATGINGFIVTFAVAFRRVVWGGGKLREGIGEGIVCGIVGVSVSPAIAPIVVFLVQSIPGLSGSMALVAAGKIELFISCMIGMIGLSAIREFVIRIARKRLGERDGN